MSDKKAKQPKAEPQKSHLPARIAIPRDVRIANARARKEKRAERTVFRQWRKRTYRSSGTKTDFRKLVKDARQRMAPDEISQSFAVFGI